MTEHSVFEYLINTVWQVPLLALATWLLIRLARPPLLTQHILWIAALALAVLLPLRGIEPTADSTAPPQANVEVLSDTGTLTEVAMPASSVSTSSIPAVTAFDQIAAYTALRIRRIPLSARAIHWAICLYTLVLALSLVRLVRSWAAARALATEAIEHPLTTLESTLLHACARHLKLAEDRIPQLRFMPGASASPMVIGIRRPLLLLPEVFRHTASADFDDQALTAVLSHELAHIRRRDYLTNLLTRIVALPIAWHPATHVFHRRIAQTREMICDRHAAGSLDSSTYAHTLIALAARIVNAHPQPAAVGLFDHGRGTHPLEERIMKLTESKLPASLAVRAVRISAGAVMLVAATATAATFHVQPSTPAAQVEQPALISQVAQPTEPPQQPQVPASAPQTPQVPASAPQTPQVPAPAPAVEAVPSPMAPTAPAVTPLPAPVAEPAPLATPIPPLPPLPLLTTVPAAPTTPPAAPAPITIIRGVGPHSLVTLDGVQRELTTEERTQLEHEFALAAKQIREATTKFDSPEFKKQMAEIQLHVDTPEFRESMKKLQVDIAKARIDTPEFHKQLDELQTSLKSGELHQQIANAQRDAFNAPELKRQMETLRLQLNSPEFRARIDDAKRLASEDKAGQQQRLAETRKQLDAASKAIAEARKQTHDDQALKQLDEAQRRIDQAAKLR